MILFQRSPIEAVHAGYVGYGWKQLNFSQYSSASELLKDFNKTYPKCSRHRNMVRRFFNLKAGDIVVVPTNRAIIIGEVIGDKRYVSTGEFPNGANQVKVNYLQQDGGGIIKIPNYKLSTALQARLRIRQTNIVLDQDFSDEINHIINEIKNAGAYYSNSLLYEQENKAVELFKINLLNNIQTNKTWIKAGGRGLEELIKELLEIEGYQASICTKNQSNGIDDIDIIAIQDDKFFSQKLVIQVKHHQGTSNSFGVKQLNEYQDENNETLLKKLLITTADNINEAAEKLANENDIRVMLGKELIDWIYDSLPKLSQSTKEKLGIFESYQLCSH